MKSCEQYVAPSSDYFVYSPSLTAKESFFYPVCVGHFFYEPGYHQKRSSYDSFLVMYIQSGELTVQYEGMTKTATANQFVLLDCYKPHEYYTTASLESLWCHFDGPMAGRYYELVRSHLGSIFTLADSSSIIGKLRKLYHTFDQNQPIREPLLSKYLTDILTDMILYTPSQTNTGNHSSLIEETVSYINEHFVEELSVNTLARQAMLSPYHFIRIFKEETGFTPHEYLINIRLNTAKYMLKTTRDSVKNICYNCGFSNESVFCTSFKKNVGMTPAAYRNNE
ncbi:MAG: AraC family transcriptional regulator [Lachnospiraceae bacterium]|nr:AraC family transcriptional regulator [Lachnospiraceae bacterium]